MPIDVKFNLDSTPVNKIIRVFSSWWSADKNPKRIVDLATAQAKATKIKSEAEAQALIVATQAQAESDSIKAKAEAETQIEIEDRKDRAKVQLEQRTRKRVTAQEERRQRNVENITAKAVLALPGEASSEMPEDDWVSQFFEYCQDVSDEQMQSLWARLLAGEVAEPGSFSPRTLWTVKHLRKVDAELFREFCRFVWSDMAGQLFPAVGIRRGNEIVADLATDALLYLQSIGLITYLSDGTLGGMHLSRADGQAVALRYHDEWYCAFLNPNVGLPLGGCSLTPVGKELYALSDPACDTGYRDSLVQAWNDLGYKVLRQPVQPTTDTKARVWRNKG